MAEPSMAARVMYQGPGDAALTDLKVRFNVCTGCEMHLIASDDPVFGSVH